MASNTHTKKPNIETTSECSELVSLAENKIADLKIAVNDAINKCEEEVKQNPSRTLMIAATAGYFLNQLPLRSIVGANLRLASSVLPPALFLYGAVKLYEFAKSQKK